MQPALNSGTDRRIDPVRSGWLTRWITQSRNVAVSACLAIAFTVFINITFTQFLPVTSANASDQPSYFAWIMLGALILLYVAAIGGVISYLLALLVSQAAIQRRRDKILDQPTDLYLYLRSFDAAQSTLWGRIRRLTDQRIANLSPFWPTVYPEHDPEERLADAINPHGVLVAIGNKRPSYGAAKLKADDAVWQQLVGDLAQRARKIFLAPSTSPGLLWEMNLVADRFDLLKKTVFIMPRNGYQSDWKTISDLLQPISTRPTPGPSKGRGRYF